MKKPVFVINVSLDECSFVNGPKESHFTREEFCIGQGGNRIYGELYHPDDRKDCPVLIMSHGFNGCSMDMRYEVEYTGPVTVFHGTDDPLVSIDYSERLCRAYKNARLIRFPGQKHGFTEPFITAMAGICAAAMQQTGEEERK